MNENFEAAIAHILAKNFGGNRSRMADALGFSPQQVSQWSSGKTRPSVESCKQIADYLGMSFEEIRDGSQFLVAEKSLEQRVAEIELKLASMSLPAGSDDDISHIVQVLQSGSPEFRRAARKMIDSLVGSF